MASLIDRHDDILKKLAQVRRIAVVGASANVQRPSHEVMAFLLSKGFEVIPVNPGLADKQVLGQTVAASLGDIDQPVDMVDVFRNSDAVPGIVDALLRLPVLPKLLWLQLGVVHAAAAEQAIAAGVDVVMNRCPAIELGAHR
ncbi:MAG: CoA-binding domain-containing protein [Candidatus Tokpelaia hoelldobleri]|uniref:CoA-binding domain-containing protein n=1 Tax=Candidatus Tokpelaia hoelldobleri TaxID=1902579 RepID=A0A1U9JTW9_9HYPH|nr:MAG: CoA-binding domain-containing protein [Candidatus Tokpelaia hoelldoblerii]